MTGKFAPKLKIASCFYPPVTIATAYFSNKYGNLNLCRYVRTLSSYDIFLHNFFTQGEVTLPISECFGRACQSGWKQGQTSSSSICNTRAILYMYSFHFNRLGILPNYLPFPSFKENPALPG